MNVSELIMTAIQEKGPVNMRQLRDALHVAGGAKASCFVCMWLHQLMREGRVSACGGVYSLVKA